MARIVYAPLVSEITGSIGGLTFQNNPSGHIVRLRPHISRSSTAKQTTAHAKLGNLLFQWQSLTGAERSLWNVFAKVWPKENKFGQDKTLTGLNWFTSLNWWRLQLDQPILTVPPAHTLPSAAPAFDIFVSSTQLQLNITGAHDYVVEPVAVWASYPTRKNTFSINQIRRLLVVIMSSPGAPYDITGPWETATGMSWDPENLFPDSNIFVCLEAINKSSGITSAMLCSSTYIETVSPYYYYS